MTRGRFDILVQPLLGTLACAQHVPGGPDVFTSFASEYVVPAVAGLAVSSPDDACRKSLHGGLLIHAQSDNARVRQCALECIKGCFDHVGEDYLFLVPETLPILAELLEDSDGRVERFAHELKTQVESISGEGLDSYLVGE